MSTEASHTEQTEQDRFTKRFEFQGSSYSMFKRIKEDLEPWYIDIIIDGSRIKRSSKTSDAAVSEKIFCEQYIAPAKAKKIIERALTLDEDPFSKKFEFDGQVYRMFKRTKDRSDPWCIDIMIDGRRIKRSSKTNNAAASEKIFTHQYIAPAKAGRWTEVDSKKSKRTWSTIGEVITCAKVSGKGVVAETTLRCYINALRATVRRGLDDDNMSDAQVDAESTGVLKGELVSSFQSWMLNNSKSDATTVKRTVKAYMRNARALFTEGWKDIYKEKGLSLPDITEWMKKKTHKVSRVVPMPPDERLVAKTFAESIHLRETDTDAYIGWLLSLCSLRRSEIRKAQRDWVKMIKGQWKFVTPGNVVKSKCDRMIPLDSRVKVELDWYYENHRKGSPDDAYILPSRNMLHGPHAKTRAEVTLRRVDDWMRGLGWTTRHTLHEMRAFFLSEFRDVHGLDATQSVAGHADQATTVGYVGYKDTSRLGVTLPLQIGAPQVVQSTTAPNQDAP